jgi:hypothetical protein
MLIHRFGSLLSFMTELDKVDRTTIRATGVLLFRRKRRFRGSCCDQKSRSRKDFYSKFRSFCGRDHFHLDQTAGVLEYQTN